VGSAAVASTFTLAGSSMTTRPVVSASARARCGDSIAKVNATSPTLILEEVTNIFFPSFVVDPGGGPVGPN
jgi:hypothetical protein